MCSRLEGRQKEKRKVERMSGDYNAHLIHAESYSFTDLFQSVMNLLSNLKL